MAVGIPDEAELLLRDAASHASRLVPTATPDAIVGDIRRAMIGEKFDYADAVAVLSGERLVGVLPFERLLAAEESTAIGDLMDADPPTLGPEVDRETAAHKMVEHGVATIAVIDEQGRFAGMIPAERMLAVMVEEHSEDMARIGGYLHGTQTARAAAEERVVLRIWHRLPWLLVGLVGAMASVGLVAVFEAQLDEKVLLAFFLPALIYMAGAVGSQTQTLVIRGMATGASWTHAIRRELISGLAIGALIGALFFPFTLIGWGEADVALAVGLAVTAACTMSTAIALALPFLLRAFGLDPAFGSGPMATVLQDLGTIVVYMGICVLVVF